MVAKSGINLGCINGNMQSEAGRGEHCTMSRSACRWNSIYDLLLRVLRGDEQRDICRRTRPGNQVNGVGVDSLREVSSV